MDIRALIDCAMGRIPADIVIRDANWACVQSGEFIPKTDVAILRHRIAYVGKDASHIIGKHTQIIEANGRFLVPGLLDAHMHVESGMLTITEFARAVIPHGTTTMFIDPHEIANVFGLRGVRLMVDEAQRQLIHVFVQMPSCVPSAPGLETPGETIGPNEVAEAMTWPGIIGLGEMMNFPGVVAGDDKVLAEIDATRTAGKVIGGHYASPDLGRVFHAYAAAGIQDDHEGTRAEDANERVRQGMQVLVRFASAWHDVESQAPAITRDNLNASRFSLCTDDSHCQTLVDEGHMDRAVREAIRAGIPPMTVLQMATINTAVHFKVSHEMGMIAPARFADLLLVRDLEHFTPDLVMCEGKILAEKGKLLVDLPANQYPEWALHSIHIPRNITREDFIIKVPSHLISSRVAAHVIGIIENQAPTRHLVLPVSIQDGEVSLNGQKDLAKVAVIERHHDSGDIQLGLVQGFGFKGSCAVATTISHDCHHLVVVGTDDENMAQAANFLRESGGGQVVVNDRKVIASVILPIGGLMSDRPATQIAREVVSVLESFCKCGCRLNNPNMQLSLLALVVIPELRISNLGLVNTSRFDFIPLLESRE
jgi:adenine deaminase